MPVSISRPASRFAALLTILLTACLPCRGRAEETSSPSDGIRSMRYEEGLVSLEAQDAKLDKVLAELSRMTQVKIVADGPIEGRITQYLNRVPLDKALRKILRGKDMSLLYTARAEASTGQHALTEVRLYVAVEGTGGAGSYPHDGYQGRPMQGSPPDPRYGERPTRRAADPIHPGDIAPRRRGPGPLPPESMLSSPPDVSYHLKMPRLPSCRSTIEQAFDRQSFPANNFENPHLT
jgi:hypothetical protein